MWFSCSSSASFARCSSLFLNAFFSTLASAASTLDVSAPTSFLRNSLSNSSIATLLSKVSRSPDSFSAPFCTFARRCRRSSICWTAASRAAPDSFASDSASSHLRVEGVGFRVQGLGCRVED